MKLKILQLINSFHTGGSERQAVQLVELLRGEKNCEVLVACLNREGVLRARIENLGLKDIPEFPLASFYDANFLRQLRRFASFLRDNKIQVVQSSDFYTNVFGMTAGRLAKTPARIAAKRETGTKTNAQRFVERRAFNFARAIVANAETVKNRLVETGVPPRKIVTIYNGLNLEKFDSPDAPRAEILRGLNLPFAADSPVAMIVANFRSPVKNQKMFLRAAQKVKKDFPAARFILAGEGGLLDEIKDFACSLGLEDEAIFPGRCDDVAKLLQAADVCVLSSTTEGFSNSILEYMAASKPVVATAVGGAAEAVVEGETGFLISSDDDENLAKRLSGLFADPGMSRKMGAAGRKIVGEKFSTAAQLEKNLALYEKILSAKSDG